MFTADVANRDKRWKLVYQLPPLPMSRHADNQFVEALGNRTAGGCPFRDDDLDWFAGDAARTIRTTMVKAVRNFYSSGKKKGNWTLTILDDGNAFAGRRLCDRNDRTTTSASPGVVSPPDGNKAGKDSEWISEVILWDQLFDVDDKLHKVTEPMHPTYWGQRALAGCMRFAIDDSRTDQVLYCERGDGSVRADGSPDMKIVKADTPYRAQPGVDVVGLTEIFGEGRSGLQQFQFRPAGGTAVTSWAPTGTTISKDVGDADEVGKPDSIDTFMVSHDRRKCYEHVDQDGALWEQGSGVDDGETVDVRDQQGDHEFTVDPYTDDEFMAEGSYVYGIVSLSFDGDHDNACRAYANVSAQQGKLLQELKETIGTMDHKNYTNAKQTMSVAAKRLNQAFGESGDPLWVKILGALENLGVGDDYVGANMSVFLPAATDLADSLDTPEIVGSSDVYKAAIVKSGQNLTWEGVAENHDDDVRNRLYNYVNLN